MSNQKSNGEGLFTQFSYEVKIKIIIREVNSNDGSNRKVFNNSWFINV